MKKIISFIIPAYNSQSYLQIVLDSLIHPDCLEDTEIIIVNDGSSDDTADIASTYVQRYPESIVLLNKENGGHGSAINVGTLAATGRYFKVIDADDWIVKENLPDFIQILRYCTADVVLTPFHQVNMEDGTKSDWRMYCSAYERIYSLEEIVADWKSFDRCLTFHGITYKTEFYQNHRHELPQGIFYEDQEYAAIPCCHAASIYPVNLYLYQYLVGNGEQSVSNTNRLKRLSHVEQVTKDLLEYDASHPQLSAPSREYLFHKTEGVILSHYVVTCIIQKNKEKGRRDVARYNQMIRELSPAVYERILKKYKAYQLMNRIHLSERLYQRLMQSRLYSVLRRTHRIERG